MMNPSNLRAMTDRECEILALATAATRADSRQNGGWFTPMDIGGSSRSDHSRILRRLSDSFGVIDEKFRPTLAAYLGSICAGRFYRAIERKEK